jgi:hypothetical protein
VRIFHTPGETCIFKAYLEGKDAAYNIFHRTVTTENSSNPPLIPIGGSFI